MSETAVSYPDIWYVPDNIHTNTRIIVRRESVTCCGCSGGDFIHCMNTPDDFIVFLSALSPQKPYEPQDDTATRDSKTHDLAEVREKWFSTLRNCYDEKEGWITDPKLVLSSMTDEIWFSHGQPLIRFSLTMQGTLCDFLTQQIFSDRLHAVLSWWYLHEATPEEKEMYEPILQKKMSEMEVEAITRAINLYNHGTYELTGLYQ